jgi:hypothetical protein
MVGLGGDFIVTYSRRDKGISHTLLNDADALARARRAGLLGQSESTSNLEWMKEDGKKIGIKVSGADFNRYDVLPIKGPLGATPALTPDAQFQGISGNPEDTEEFRKLQFFQEGTSTYNGAGTGIGSAHTWFAVLLDKIKDGKLGPAKVSGIFAREITVNYPHHRFARMSARSPNTMESALSGPFRIWSRHNNLGDDVEDDYPRSEWCILEANAYPAGQIFTGKSNGAIALDATNGSVSVWDCYGGSFADTGEDVEVTAPFGAISAIDKRVAFTIPEGCNYYELLQGRC